MEKKQGKKALYSEVLQNCLVLPSGALWIKSSVTLNNPN